MGLPSYIINFDELIPIIKEAIDSADIKVDLDNLTLDASSLNIDTSKIEEIIKDILKEMVASKNALITASNTTKLIQQELQKHGVMIDEAAQDLSDKLGKIFDEAKELYKILDEISNKLNSNGTSKIKGFMLSVPGVKKSYEIIFNERIKNILLRGITISQSAWNIGDKWNLKVGEVTLFRDVYTKLKAEFKEFDKYYPVPRATDVVLTYDNVSGNSKVLWLDFEYVELAGEINIPGFEPGDGSGNPDIGDRTSFPDIYITLSSNSEFSIHKSHIKFLYNGIFASSSIDSTNGLYSYPYLYEYDHTYIDEETGETITEKRFQTRYNNSRSYNFDDDNWIKIVDISSDRKTYKIAIHGFQAPITKWDDFDGTLPANLTFQIYTGKDILDEGVENDPIMIEVDYGAKHIDYQINNLPINANGIKLTLNSHYPYYLTMTNIQTALFQNDNIIDESIQQFQMGF